MSKEKRIEKFYTLMKKVLPEEKTTNLIARLNDMGYFVAPASVKYHGNYEGGLFDHSYEVTNQLIHLTETLGLEWDRPESPLLIGMLHDICKCDNYVKHADGTYSYFTNCVLNGHGDKSVILAQKLIDLTDEEVLCIRWHMGAFDDKENWNAYGKAVEMYPNVLYTHTADMIASHVKGI